MKRYEPGSHRFTAASYPLFFKKHIFWGCLWGGFFTSFSMISANFHAMRFRYGALMGVLFAALAPFIEGLLFIVLWLAYKRLFLAGSLLPFIGSLLSIRVIACFLSVGMSHYCFDYAYKQQKEKDPLALTLWVYGLSIMGGAGALMFYAILEFQTLVHLFWNNSMAFMTWQLSFEALGLGTLYAAITLGLHRHLMQAVKLRSVLIVAAIAVFSFAMSAVGIWGEWR